MAGGQRLRLPVTLLEVSCVKSTLGPHPTVSSKIVGFPGQPLGIRHISWADCASRSFGIVCRLWVGHAA
jgi:hypothetical protein